MLCNPGLCNVAGAPLRAGGVGGGGRALAGGSGAALGGGRGGRAGCGGGARLAGKDEGQDEGKDDGQLGIVSAFPSDSFLTTAPLFGALEESHSFQLI